MINRKRKALLTTMSIILLILVVVAGILGIKKFNLFGNPDEQKRKVLDTYMSSVVKKDYETMWSLISKESQARTKKEDFIKRNQNIYEGMDTSNIVISDIVFGNDKKNITYKTMLETNAGEITFENELTFIKETVGFKIDWTDALIFPDLTEDDIVRIAVDEAIRGDILDRKGIPLATQGDVSEVGFVPGKMNKGNRDDLQKIADILEITVESIEKKLSASWVNDESFVPIKKIKKYGGDYEIALASNDVNALLHQRLLEVPGVLINTVTERVYPLGECATALTGYVQKMTAEDLEKHADEGYTQNSYIGKTGLEYLYEKQLKGENGCRIWIENKKGEEKQIIAVRPISVPENITTTIDANLQRYVYEAFATDKAASVAMNPYTGAVLALVSAPSFDANQMVLGLSEAKWTSLNEDPAKPMFNRFRASWVPGSTFKPVTGAIAVNSGKLDPNADLGHSGLAWQKESSWGGFSITTLKEYQEPANLQNGLIYSDNIYFAKVAMQVGIEEYISGLKSLGFDEEMDFLINMEISKYGEIATEVDLANSGYGQAQMLVNPLHMASIYTSFLNGGDMILPIIDNFDKRGQVWHENVFSMEVAELIKSDMTAIIANTSSVFINNHGATFAGKTGTAEIKASQDDKNGTELGWFNLFTIDKDHNDAILMVSMVEDVKDRGSSSYVVNKTNAILEKYLK